MTRISCRRVAIAATLAASLTLAAPVHAAGLIGWAPDSSVFQTAWQWMASFWAPPAIPAHHVVRSTKSDRSSGIDPNSTPSSSTAPCLPNLDRGCGVDPNG
jgi:hypothetical protein